jgi:NADPH:quinone reductase-like Zn-dependent oxidoreductase
VVKRFDLEPPSGPECEHGLLLREGRGVTESQVTALERNKARRKRRSHEGSSSDHAAFSQQRNALIHHDGGYGSLVKVPSADTTLVRLPDGVDSFTAAALGCRFMTAYHGIVDQAAVRPGE